MNYKLLTNKFLDADLAVSGGENIYAEVGEVGIENPAFEAEAAAAVVKADVAPDLPDVAEQTKLDENQNFYADISSEDRGRRELVIWFLDASVSITSL